MSRLFSRFRLLLPLLLALSLLAGGEARLVHQLGHELRQLSLPQAPDKHVARQDGCLTCAAYASLGASLLPVLLLPALLAGVLLFSRSRMATLRLPFVALFRSRAPPHPEGC